VDAIIAVVSFIAGTLFGIHLRALGSTDEPSVPIHVPFVRSKQKLKPKSLSDAEIAKREMSGPPVDPS